MSDLVRVVSKRAAMYGDALASRSVNLGVAMQRVLSAVHAPRGEDMRRIARHTSCVDARTRRPDHARVEHVV